MGAVCKVCGKDMMKVSGCSITKLHVGGKVYNRIKVGDPGDFDEDSPACGHQLISCACEKVFIE